MKTLQALVKTENIRICPYLLGIPGELRDSRALNVFLLCDGTTSQGNKEPITCCTAESTVACTVWSVLLEEGFCQV